MCHGPDILGKFSSIGETIGNPFRAGVDDWVPLQLPPPCSEYPHTGHLTRYRHSDRVEDPVDFGDEDLSAFFQVGFGSIYPISIRHYLSCRLRPFDINPPSDFAGFIGGVDDACNLERITA